MMTMTTLEIVSKGMVFQLMRRLLPLTHSTYILLVRVERLGIQLSVWWAYLPVRSIWWCHRLRMVYLKSSLQIKLQLYSQTLKKEEVEEKKLMYDCCYFVYRCLCPHSWTHHNMYRGHPQDDHNTYNNILVVHLMIFSVVHRFQVYLDLKCNEFSVLYFGKQRCYLPRHRNVGSPAYWVGYDGALSPGSRYGHFCSTVWHTLRQGLILFLFKNSIFLRDLKFLKLC